jgi:hypothetical protein
VDQDCILTLEAARDPEEVLNFRCVKQERRHQAVRIRNYGQQPAR